MSYDPDTGRWTPNTSTNDGSQYIAGERTRADTVFGAVGDVVRDAVIPNQDRVLALQAMEKMSDIGTQYGQVQQLAGEDEPIERGQLPSLDAKLDEQADHMEATNHFLIGNELISGDEYMERLAGEQTTTVLDALETNGTHQMEDGSWYYLDEEGDICYEDIEGNSAYLLDGEWVPFDYSEEE